MSFLDKYRFDSKLSIAAGIVVLGVSVMFLRKCANNRRLLAKSRSEKPIITHVIVYPIKGCAGVERYSVELSNNGFEHDREFAIVHFNSSNECVSFSQTNYPKLSLVRPEFPTGSCLTVHAPGMASLLAVPVILTGEEYLLNYFGDKVRVVDQGDLPAAWFTQYMGVDCRLVRVFPGEFRLDKDTLFNRESNLFFQTPVLLLGDASVSALSKLVEYPNLEYNRFRPNILITGLPPFEEDMVAKWTIGNILLNAYALCDRCSIPAVEQKTGTLQTNLLGKMRRARIGKDLPHHPNLQPLKPTEYYLAVYCKPVVENSTVVFVGQEITPHY